MACVYLDYNDKYQTESINKIIRFFVTSKWLELTLSWKKRRSPMGSCKPEIGSASGRNKAVR